MEKFRVLVFVLVFAIVNSALDDLRVWMELSRYLAFTRREVRAMTPAELELYDPLHGFEPVLPIIAQTSEHAGHFTDA